MYVKIAAALVLASAIGTDAFAGLNRPLLVNRNIGDPLKKSVLVYYANETLETPRFGELTEWLSAYVLGPQKLPTCRSYASLAKPETCDSRWSFLSRARATSPVHRWGRFQRTSEPCSRRMRMGLTTEPWIISWCFQKLPAADPWTGLSQCVFLDAEVCRTRVRPRFCAEGRSVVRARLKGPPR